jgi:tRNA threonylcarbamoyladenosine biosynthesis protein TsaB
MRLMALSTAVAEAGLCLHDGKKILATWHGPPRSGPGPILRAARSLLEDAGIDFAELDGLAFGRGPGAFTGVRLGVALAQGLHLAAGVPLVPVSDLAALAWQGFRSHGWDRVMACLDARQGEIYWGGFDCSREGAHKVTDECIGVPAMLDDYREDEWAWAGSGVPFLTALSENARKDAVLTPTVEAIAELGVRELSVGHTAELAGAMPHYLRNRVAEPSPRHRRRRGLSVSE